MLKTREDIFEESDKVKKELVQLYDKLMYKFKYYLFCRWKK
jgi:hypothetical protein